MTNLPIKCQSNDLWPIQCQSLANMPIHHQFVYPTPILYQSANPSPICQFITYLPIHYKSTNPMPIKFTTISIIQHDSQYRIATHWHCIGSALTKVTPIYVNRRTFVHVTWELVNYGDPTEVSRRRTISQSLSIWCKSCAIPSPISYQSIRT